MANAQVLVLVRSSSALDPSQIQGPIEAAARAAGFVPGPWTFNTQSVQITPVAAGGGVVSGGDWNGDTVSETIPAGGSRLAFNSYRQNFLNGPDPASVTTWPFSSSAVGTILRALPGVSSARIAFRAPGNSISWDRGVPAPIALVATAPSGSNGALLGIFAVGVLAFVASRGSGSKPKPMFAGARGRGRLGKLSTNREGLTFDEWRRAAGVPASTPGAHSAWARGEDPSDWRVAMVASRARY